MEAKILKDDETIQGVVSMVLWKDESTSKAIVSFKAKDGNIPKFAQRRGYPDSFTAIGVFYRIGKGQVLELKGGWSKDNRGRWSFRINSYEDVVPNDDEAMIDYLSSGLFRGVGPKTAKAIVNMFGSKSLEVIKSQPEKLEKVRGISKTKAQQITEDYQLSAHMEKLMLSLKPFNIPTTRVIKIHEKYGKEAVEKITDNPYKLCEDIEGIGFITADMIARSCNKSPNDDYRIRAGIIHTLKETSMTEGHTYLPFDLLVSKTKENLEQGQISGEINRNDIIRVSIDMNNMEEIVIEEDGAAYLPLYLASERSSAHKVRLLLNREAKKFHLDVEEAIAELEKEQKIKYADKQKEAFRTLDKGNLTIITGGPGTGKTTIIKGIIGIYKKNFPGSRIILAAPTGRAAKRMEEATSLKAMTIHRQLEYRPSQDGNIQCGRNEKNPLDADLIIVDESSMIDILLFSTFLKAIKPSTSLVIVGDIDQLPSVGAGNVLKDLIDSDKVPIVYLNEIFRQKDASKIIVNASNINKGICDLELSDDFQFVEENDPFVIPEIIKTCFKNELMKVKDINEIQVLSPFRRNTETGVNQLNLILQKDLNAKEKGEPEIVYRRIPFRRYDKVMQYKNNYDKEVYNGDVGVILEINSVEGRVVVDMDGEKVEYFKDELDEIQLAYATTIHKSQGSEFDTIIIPVSMQHKRMLQRNLLYTAVTRAKRKVILVGSKKALNYAIRNNKVNGRFSKLDKRI